jgi:hypothetical protein
MEINNIPNMMMMIIINAAGIVNNNNNQVGITNEINILISFK